MGEIVEFFKKEVRYCVKEYFRPLVEGWDRFGAYMIFMPFLALVVAVFLRALAWNG